MWRYALKDWHLDSGLTHELWWASLLAEGWEPELPDLAEGSLIESNGRHGRRDSVKRWVPDRLTKDEAV